MAHPSEGDGAVASASDRSWSTRDHAVFVATVALGALLPPVVAQLRGADAWAWVVVALGATWYVERSRRAGGIAGVTTPGGRRFCYAVFWFYVTATVMTVAVLVLLGPTATTHPETVVNVLAPAGAVGGGTWVRLSPG